MEVLKNVFSSGGQKAKAKKRKSAGVDVPRVRSSSSSNCIQESEREGYVFVEKLKEGNSTSDVQVSEKISPLAAPKTNPAMLATTLASPVEDVLIQRMTNLQVPLAQDAVQNSPSSVASYRLNHTLDDNFLTLKNVKGGFCLDKRMEAQVEKHRNGGDGICRPRPQLDLTLFDYDFSLERTVLKDYD